jgi:hypothetical protein
MKKMKALKLKIINRFVPIVIGLLIVTSCNSTNTNSSEESTFVEKDSISNYIVFEDYSNTDLENKSLNEFRDFEVYKELFDTMKIDGLTYFIVEGDLLLDIEDLAIQFNMINKPNDNQKLVGIIIDGEIVKIENPTNIRYSIIKETFSEKEYVDLVEFMNEAIINWKSVCNVNFVHISELDSKLRPTDNPDELVFVVRKIGYTPNGLLASAFFPYDPKNKRKILITPSFFTTSFSKAGILRHEIGHILGFRHEYIRSGAPALCPNESLDLTIDLTQYDPQSVMHYFCGGFGSKDLKITSIDSIGASMMYK